MIKCPYCDNYHPFKPTSTKYNQDGWEIEMVNTYFCPNCHNYFNGYSYFHCQEAYEIIEKA